MRHQRTGLLMDMKQNPSCRPRPDEVDLLLLELSFTVRVHKNPPRCKNGGRVAFRICSADILAVS